MWAQIVLVAVFSFSVSAADNKVLFVSGSHSNKAKVALLQKFAAGKGVEISHFYAKDFGEPNEVKALFDRHDLVLMHGVSSRETKQTYAKFSPVIAQSTSRFVPIKWLDGNALVKGVSGEQAKTIAAYYLNGGKENFIRMVAYLNAEVFFTNKTNQVVLPPVIYPVQGIYHPEHSEKIFSSLDDYLNWREAKSDGAVRSEKRVGILFQRANIESAQTELVDRAILQLEAQGVLAIPFFFELSRGEKDYLNLLQKLDMEGKKQTFVDLILSFRNIHWANQRRVEFEKLGVSVMQALNYYTGTQSQWEQDSQGVSPGMTPFQLVLPESAGVIDPLIVAAVDREAGSTDIFDYQFDHLIDKAMKVLTLKHKKNTDKKLTVMVWGNRDVGASFLNIPESLSSISRRLNQENYFIPSVEDNYFTNRIDRILTPFYRHYELDALVRDDLAELMPVKDYLAWFNTLPEHVRNPINEYWGEAKNNFMVVERNGEKVFVLPRIRAGNMLVMRQPARADNDDEDKRIYHKGTIPMNHYYLAAYYYARQYWGSDAIVHLGTHGSHEYLPGKERGLSLYDQGNLAVWDTPVVYPFIVDDVGEAMQTKRRGRATVLAHMTPPFAAAGLHGAMADIHELMHQYKSLDKGGVKEKTGKEIVSKCVIENICEDFGWTQTQIDQDFEGFMVALHDYLVDLASQNQPLGLHTFGELPEERLVISTLIQMLGTDFTAHAAEHEKELAEKERHHHDHEQGHDHHHEHEKGHSHDSEDFGKTVINESSGDVENLIGYRTVEKYIVRGDDISGLENELQDFIKKGRKLFGNLSGIQELNHLVKFLESGYIPVKNGGDPIRHPESVPTGFNLYGFDPARVPTKAAYEQGKELTEQLIADYYNKNGRYPDKLAFSLWSMETMRHYGVLEAQALYAMGVKPVWTSDGRVVGSEIIPASELKRPRVDVVLSATGLYRDAFPNVMQWLAKAVDKVAKLKEDNNSIWKNTQKIKTDLMAEGIEEEEAEYLSSVRLFSNESGNYGSGLGDATVQSDTWEADAKLADLYLSRMGYYYGVNDREGDNKRWGKKITNAKGEEISLYSKTLSGTDIALFSRSSNVYGMLASDDPFQYFGGLALAVRNIDGESPEMFISNLRDANNPKAENAANFLAKEVRTRAFHPRWVEEMKKEGYSGAVTMASTVSNFFGWQVMDPDLVRGDQWQEFFEVYIEDKHNLELNEWFEEVDPKAQKAILERMLEATRKDYWQPNDQTLQKMVERYQYLVNQHDLIVDNEKLREFMEAKALGFGLDLSLPAAEIPATDISAAVNPESSPTESVEGQKLEKVEQSTEADRDYTIHAMLLGCLFFMLMGAWQQAGWYVPGRKVYKVTTDTHRTA